MLFVSSYYKNIQSLSGLNLKGLIFYIFTLKMQKHQLSAVVSLQVVENTLNKLGVL